MIEKQITAPPYTHGMFYGCNDGRYFLIFCDRDFPGEPWACCIPEKPEMEKMLHNSPHDKSIAYSISEKDFNKVYKACLIAIKHNKGRFTSGYNPFDMLYLGGA